MKNFKFKKSCTLVFHFAVPDRNARKVFESRATGIHSLYTTFGRDTAKGLIPPYPSAHSYKSPLVYGTHLGQSCKFNSMICPLASNRTNHILKGPNSQSASAPWNFMASLPWFQLWKIAKSLMVLLVKWHNNSHMEKTLS